MDNIVTKKCTKCESVKILSEYTSDKRTKDGKRAYCRKCSQDYDDFWRKNFPDKKKEKSSLWYRNGGKEKSWKNQIKYRYGVTLEIYEEMLLKQNGVCAICKQKPHGKLNIDHDHTNGDVRGLLCGNCNRAIGLLKEDFTIAKNAVDYLSK